MPPNGWMKLHPGDALIMQGAVPTIGSLVKSNDFQFMEEVKIGDRALRSLDLITVEALLSPNSRYTGRTMQQTNFGRDYGFSVLGISRHGETIQERPSATRLEYGDSLLLLGHNSNLERLERNPNLIEKDLEQSKEGSSSTQTTVTPRPATSTFESAALGIRFAIAINNQIRFGHRTPVFGLARALRVVLAGAKTWRSPRFAVSASKNRLHGEFIGFV